MKRFPVLFSFLFVLLLLNPLVRIAAQELGPEIKKDFFPFSVWYSGGKARAPMLSRITDRSEEEWRKDLQQIKDLGFNTVRTWVEWATCEPEPGEYNFENLHLLMRLAEETGLKVFIQVYVDSAPEWIAKKFPDALFEAQSGDKVYPQSAPGVCMDNPPAEEAILRFYSETAKAASQHPNLFGWDLWSEPHIINWAAIDYVPNVQFCFCPGTRSRFQNWLKKKYNTLTALNEAWYRNFKHWNEVEPPRFSTILSYSDFVDWKTFIYEKLVDDMDARYQAIRQEDPTRLITAHAVGASLFQSPHVGNGATDDFLMARPLDYYGVSLYPKHNHPDRAWSLTTLRTVMDFIRSANREKGGWYVGELQAGHGTVSLLVSDPVTPEDHRIWAWSAIAKGARGVNLYAYYPMSSGYEAGGYGLIQLDGSLTERAVSTGKIAKTVDRHQDLFLNSTPAKAEIGIVYNPLTQMVGGMQRRDYPGAMSQSLIGYYQTFANHNVPVDFIHREHIEKEALSQYKLIILPFPVMFSREAAAGLRAFVQNGGHVLAEARLGWNDERGYASEIIPGLGMHDIFGANENEVRMRDQIEFAFTDEDHPVLEGLQKGQKLRGSLYSQTLNIEDESVRILATDAEGAPALVSHPFGKGEAMLAGSYLGMASFPEPDSVNDQLFINLLDWAGITRPYTTSADGRTADQVEVRLKTGDDGYVLFLINHSPRQEKVSIRLKVDLEGLYQVANIIDNTENEVQSSDGVLSLSFEPEGKGVKVMAISRKN